MVGPEHTHTSSIKRTRQVIFRNIRVYLYTYTHAIISSEKKEPMNLKDSRERYMGGFERKKGKEEI